jgi:hypothetical protein
VGSPHSTYGSSSSWGGHPGADNSYGAAFDYGPSYGHYGGGYENANDFNLGGYAVDHDAGYDGTYAMDDAAFASGAFMDLDDGVFAAGGDAGAGDLAGQYGYGADATNHGGNSPNSKGSSSKTKGTIHCDHPGCNATFASRQKLRYANVYSKLFPAWNI